MCLRSQLFARKKQKEHGFEACLGFMVNLSQKKKKKEKEKFSSYLQFQLRWRVLLHYIFVLNVTDNMWTRGEESDLKKDWVAVSSMSRCVLCHVLRGAGSWRSPWVWKEGALKPGLPSDQRSGKKSTCRKSCCMCGGSPVCSSVCSFSPQSQV